MRGRQVAAVGAEAEDADVAIAPGLEAGDLLVVGDAADLRSSRRGTGARSGSWSESKAIAMTPGAG